MNPRQRRAVLLLALSALGLLGVFVLVAGYVSNIRGEVEPKVDVLVLTRSVPAHAGVQDDMVKEESVPKRWAPRNALTDASQLVNLVTTTQLDPDTVLQQGMLVPPPRLAPGQQELSILVDAETGVAGRVQPDDNVDIVAAYSGESNGPDVATVVVPGARVLAVGQPQIKGGQNVKDANATVDPKQVVPITFALTPRQVLKVEHAETFASEVRLALLRPGDQQPGLGKGESYYARTP
jgi:pilus assembly protein CpaB